MKPVKALAATLSTLLAADTTILANASALKVGLITQEFTPSIDRVIGDLTIASGNGLDPLAGVAGAQNESVDAGTGELIVEIKPPAGGFRWETSGGFVGPKTVYGFALTNNAGSTLYGTETLAEPIELTADNQAVSAPPLMFRIDPNKVQ